MTAQELARMVSDWSDALTVAEVVSSPFLRVTEKWDLHDCSRSVGARAGQIYHLAAARETPFNRCA